MWPGYKEFARSQGFGGGEQLSTGEGKRGRDDEKEDTNNDANKRQKIDSSTEQAPEPGTAGDLGSYREDPHQWEPIQLSTLKFEHQMEYCTEHGEDDVASFVQACAPMQRLQELRTLQDQNQNPGLGMEDSTQHPQLQFNQFNQEAGSQGIHPQVDQVTARLIENQQRLIQVERAIDAIRRGGALPDEGQPPVVSHTDLLSMQRRSLEEAQSATARLEETLFGRRNSSFAHGPVAASLLPSMSGISNSDSCQQISSFSALAVIPLGGGVTNPNPAQIDPPTSLPLPRSVDIIKNDSFQQELSFPSQTKAITDDEILALVPRPALPALDKGPIRHYTQRQVVSLGLGEDHNWLSQFLCFIRSDLVEVFCANTEDVSTRMNSKVVALGQVGIRCRFCAHLRHSDRANRAASFPSSMSRIYQSLTMMVRDHFGSCSEMPDATKATFTALKAKTTQGATDSKKYWIESAMLLGMADTANEGIMCSETNQAAALLVSSGGRKAKQELLFSAAGSATTSRRPQSAVILVAMEADKHLVSELTFLLMTQVQRIVLQEEERVGNRRVMDAGTPGFGCRHCCAAGRMGMCRFFSSRRRTLPSKLKDLHDHLRRCASCPAHIKEELARLEAMEASRGEDSDSVVNHKAFFDRVWSRLITEEDPPL
jgi:hypothetical protein